MTSSAITNSFDRQVDARHIEGFAREVARLFNPEKVILFGSYAYGNPTKDSDVDFLIVTRHRGPGHRLATRIRLAVAVSFPIDLLVRSSAELRRGMSQLDWFIIDVLEKGIVLHDSMTAQTLQWVRKAEADYDAVLLLRRSR